MFSGLKKKKTNHITIFKFLLKISILCKWLPTKGSLGREIKLQRLATNATAGSDATCCSAYQEVFSWREVAKPIFCSGWLRWVFKKIQTPLCVRAHRWLRRRRRRPGTASTKLTLELTIPNAPKAPDEVVRRPISVVVFVAKPFGKNACTLRATSKTNKKHFIFSYSERRDVSCDWRFTCTSVAFFNSGITFFRTESNQGCAEYAALL